MTHIDESPAPYAGLPAAAETFAMALRVGDGTDAAWAAWRLRATIGNGPLRPAGTRGTTAALPRIARAATDLALAYTGRPLPWRRRLALRGASIDELTARALRMLGATRDPGGNPVPDGPTGTPAWHSFTRIQQHTHCIFARRSRIWAAPEGGADQAGALTGFVRAARRERLDGFVIRVTDPDAAADLDGLAGTTRRLLTELTARDPRRNPGIEGAGRPDWHLRYQGERFFALTMSSCYPVTSSRHTFGEPGVFVLLQPDHAFDRVVAPDGDGLIPMSARSRIREEYDAHGRSYDLALTASPVEAHRYVKPAGLGDAAVDWWTERRPRDEAA